MSVLLEDDEYKAMKDMIMNPETMLAENDVAKALYAEYLAPMANQSISEKDARAILEYFRTIYEEEFVFEKYNEDGSLNEYQYVEWDHLPSNIKDFYRGEANKNVIEPIELKKIF